jgi:hypothetical protein
MNASRQIGWMDAGRPGALAVGVSLAAAAAAAAGFIALAAGNSPWIALGALGAAGVCVGMFLSPSFCFLMVAISLPLERIGRMTEDFESFTISMSRIVGLVALVAFLMHSLLRRRRIRFGAAFWLYAGYTALAVLGIGWALSEKDAIRDAQRIVGNLLFFFLVINTATRQNLVRLAVSVWLLVNVGTVGYAAYQYHYGQKEAVEENQMSTASQRFTAVVSDDAETSALGEKVKRVYGTTSHPGLFGLNLVMTIPFFAWVMRGRRPFIKLLWAAGLAVVLYGILLSNTRFVFLLAALVIVATVLMKLWEVPRITFAVLALAGLASVPFLPRDFVMRSLDPSLYGSGKSQAIRIRFKMLDKAFDLLADHWLLGIGVGNQDIIPAMITDELGGRITSDGLKASAHNEFVWSMVEVGVFGWLLHWSFVALIVAASIRAARALKRLGDPESDEQRWLMKACQVTLIAVPFFGVQTEVFHFALKGWWFVAGLAWVIYCAARRAGAGAAAGPEVLAA